MELLITTLFNKVIFNEGIIGCALIFYGYQKLVSIPAAREVKRNELSEGIFSDNVLKTPEEEALLRESLSEINEKTSSPFNYDIDPNLLLSDSVSKESLDIMINGLPEEFFSQEVYEPYVLYTMCLTYYALHILVYTIN